MSEPFDARKAIAAIGAEDAPAYELAFREARRALDAQERALAAFGARAGVVLSTAAIATSFLGGQALNARGLMTFAWTAVAAFAVVGGATLCVLWPDEQWQFEVIPNQLLSTYIEREDGAQIPLAVIHRDLALHMENSYLINEQRRLRPLRWAVRVAVIALVGEVAIWLADLAIGP